MALFFSVLTLLIISLFLMGFKVLLFGKRFTKESASLQHRHHHEDCEASSCSSCSASEGCSSFRV